MQITILNGSPRPGGNTDTMAGAFARGAKEAGHQVEMIHVARKKIAACKGCQYCRSHKGVCIQKDDMEAVLHTLDHTELLVLASPIYCFDMTGQLKCTLDRMYPRGRYDLPIREAALLLNSVSEGVFEGAKAQFHTMVDYYGWKNRGILTISGMTVEKDGAMERCPRLAEAYELGRFL